MRNEKRPELDSLRLREDVRPAGHGNVGRSGKSSFIRGGPAGESCEPMLIRRRPLNAVPVAGIRVPPSSFANCKFLIEIPAATGEKAAMIDADIRRPRPQRG